MKYMMYVVVAVIFLAILLAKAQSASAFAFQDPQLCVNGLLLTVVPPAPGDVRVKVPKDANVDFVVAHCGGNDVAIPESNVTFHGDKNKMEVIVAAPKGTKVTFSYNGDVVKKKTQDGQAKAKFKLP